MKVDTYSKVGAKKGEVTLSKAVFGVDANADQLKTAYNRYWANIRTNNARVLSRGEVSGGGRKPWRQKGTGRARFGSSRNPIWRHGGVAFGPSGIENYSKSMPKSMIRSSIKQALSASVSKIKVIEAFSASEYSTKKVVGLIDKIGAEGLILIVAAKLDEKFIASARNIAGVKLLSVNQLNVPAILDADAILINTDALSELDKWLVKTSKKPAVSGAKK
ncbi:MAG: 50S ribosomal protein L4 [Chryseobacterium sp.]|nr:MAG: 50S ribosomal protein L4 [Chryseobacterium sp.]